MVGVIAGLFHGEFGEGADEKTGSHHEHDAESDFGEDETLATPSAATTGGASACVGQSGAKVNGGGIPGGEETKADAGEERNQQHGRHDACIEMDIGPSAELLRVRGEQTLEGGSGR